MHPEKSASAIRKACVALAHKLARIIWAVLSKGEEYKPQSMGV